MEIALGALGILVLVALVVLIALQFRTPAPAENQSLGLLQNQLNSLQERLDKFGQTVSNTLQNSTTPMNTRLDNAAKLVGDLREKVGQIHEVGKAAARIPTGEQSGLLTRIAMTESVSLCTQMKVDGVCGNWNRG